MGPEPGKKFDLRIWDEYEKIIKEFSPEVRDLKRLEVGRFEFYERAKKSYAVVHTG